MIVRTAERYTFEEACVKCLTFGASLLGGALPMARGGTGGATRSTPVGGGGGVAAANGAIDPVATTAVAPQPSPRAIRNCKTFFDKCGPMRSWVIANLNGDRLEDIVATQSHFQPEARLAHRTLDQQATWQLSEPAGSVVRRAPPNGQFESGGFRIF